MEQVNIEGKRSGEGFVAHKDALVNALSRALAERVMLFDDSVNVGRKGLLGYLKALTGNIVKVVPVNGSASGSQAADKGLKVIVGNHQSYIPNGAWLKDKTPFTLCQVRVLPHNAVMPNLGSVELAEALSRVLPFTSSDKDRPVLGCVKLEIKEGKLTLVSADGFRLAIANLNLGECDGEILISRDDLKGLIPALRKAKRVRLAIEQKADAEGGLLNKYAVIDTELVRYKLPNQDGSFPDYGKVIPTEFTANANFDTKEAIKACRNLLALWFNDDVKPLYRTLILTVGGGKLAIETKQEGGKAEIEAQTDGEGKIAVNGKYLLEALKACGEIVNLQMVSPTSAMVFSRDGYEVVVMPTALPEVRQEAKADAVAEAEKVAQEADKKAKPKRKGKGKTKETVVEPATEGEREPTEAELARIEAEADLVPA